MSPSARPKQTVTDQNASGDFAGYLTAAGAFLGFFVPAVHLFASLGLDWKYFDSMTLVVRTSVLRHHRMPLHDPWVMGGMDVLGNPQSRVFSPSLLFDLLLRPPYANHAYLIACALIGAFGGYRLLIGLGRSRPVSVACALLFVNSTWFALHDVEGHLPFGTFYLLPWVLHCVLNAAKPRYVLGLLSLLTLFLLDGGMYPFIHSIVLILGCAATGLLDLRSVLAEARRSWRVYVLGTAACALIAAAKVVPVLLIFGRREPVQEFTVMPAGLVADALLNPLHTVLELPPGSSHRFHEYGCYIGIVAVLTVLVFLASKDALRTSVPYLALMAFCLWTATGWGNTYNPWTVFQKLPLLNNAHVQSRFLLLFHLFFIVLLARALDVIPWPRAAHGLLIFLTIEALFACGYVWETAYALVPGPAYEKDVITSDIIVGTLNDASKPWHYFEGRFGARNTYEPAALSTAIRVSGEPGYRGEVYTTSGEGQVSLREFTPGHIVLETRSPDRLVVEINSNYLQGWKISEGGGKVYGTAAGLIAVEVSPGHRRVVLRYAPRYLPWTLAAFAVGLALLLTTWILLLRNRPLS